MTCFHLLDDTKKEDAIVARVHKTHNESVISREKEFQAIQIAHASGCFPAIYAVFNNGLMYHYAQGRVMTLKDLTKPEVIRLVTRQLHKLHTFPVESIDLKDRIGNLVTMDKSHKTLKDMLKMIPNKANDSQRDVKFQMYRTELTDESLNKEVNIVEDILEKLQLPRSLTHGDFHTWNMLFDEEKETITFIDFEFSSFNYSCRDLAYLFVLRPYLEMSNMVTANDPDLTESVKRQWLHCYLEAKYQSMGLPDRIITTSNLELFTMEHKMMQIIYGLEFTIMGLAHVNLHFDTSFLDSIPVSKELYFSHRNDLLLLKDTYLDLKKSLRLSV